MLNRAISRIYDEAIREHGLKFSQMNILTMVTLHGPIAPIDVGRMLSLEKSSLSRNVALMEEKGWLLSEAGERGGRVLTTTAAGRQLLERAMPGWRDAQRRVVSMLGERTSDELRRAAARSLE